MRKIFKTIFLLGIVHLTVIGFTGCGGWLVTLHSLNDLKEDKAIETYVDYEYGVVDADAINDYLNGIRCHYSEGIIVGLGEREDEISLRRFGHRFPVIIISSTGKGNLADMVYYASYGPEGNRNLDCLYFDKCLYIHSGGGIYRVRAKEKVYLDPALFRPTYPGLNHTISDLTSVELCVMYDSAGNFVPGLMFRDFRFFRGIFNAHGEGFNFTDHESLVQFEQIGFELDGDNERCLIIDEPKWESRIYEYDSASDTWILKETLPGFGYPEEGVGED